jgi:ribonuclease Z
LKRAFVLFLWGPPVVYDRQSNVPDLGALAQRAGVKHLMLAHLGPSLGSPVQGPWKIPGGPLNEADYKKAAQESGFTGNIVVGTDLATIRLPAK